MQPIIKLAIVDDNIFFRKSLCIFLAKNENIQVVADVSDGAALLSVLMKQTPDVVLLDLEMPVMDGIKTSEHLVKHYPSVKILIHTVHEDNELSQYLIEKGANGFLQKSNDFNQIKEGIYAVAKHEYYFAGWDLKKIIAAKNNKPSAVFVKNVFFSKRELEIIYLICQQHTNKEISEKLFISPRTVDGHRDNILQKTNARNVTGIVVYAMQNGLVHLSHDEKPDTVRHRKNNRRR